ncbi:MAG TPA: TIM-barrel domain-containing protein, partial [Armatimonadota bacterium]
MPAAVASSLEFSVVRDFRIPGMPMGYLVVQSDAYYAWWEVHQPDTICIHRANGEGPEWLTLRVGGTLEMADGTTLGGGVVTLANTDAISALCDQGREWAGGGARAASLELIFRAEDSSLEYHVILYPDRIDYRLQSPVTPPARVRRCLLAPDTAIQADRLYNAGPIAHGVYEAPLHHPQYIRPDWFTPPPFCYAFHLADDTWMTAALEAGVGDMPFQRFCTVPDAAGRLSFAVEYGSEPPLGESFCSPPLVWRFNAVDPHTALRQHAEGMRADAVLASLTRTPADWWHGVMVCGWHWQTQEAKRLGTNWGGACRQDVYAEMVSALEAHDIDFDILTIDMFWGKEHGIWRADIDRWPDLRGFIDRQHAKGRRVLLWICTNVQGLPDDELYRVGERRLLDPLNLRWIARMQESCRHMFSPEPGCLHADGLKFDFTEAMPPAGEPHCTRELHGLDYLHALFTTVYNAAKTVREDVLMDFQVAHPAFAPVYDMTRLNDYFL